MSGCGIRRAKREARYECSCTHGGSCIQSGYGAVCACAGPWGGVRCDRYKGHDHACAALQCHHRALCVWGTDESPYCLCPPGGECEMTSSQARGGMHRVLTGMLTASAVLLTLVAVLYVIHRRRTRSFQHARLADNVEISNPMYLGGDDDHDLTPPHNLTTNGGHHFANPVYESMFNAQPPAHDEQANLLSSADGSPPPAEHAALL